MTSKNRKTWNFQILSDRPDRPIPAIWIGRIVGKSIFRCFPRHWTRISRFRLRRYIFVDCRPIFHLFQSSKIHVWVGIQISANIFAEKNLWNCFVSPVNISWIGSKLMKISKNAMWSLVFRTHYSYCCSDSLLQDISLIISWTNNGRPRLCPFHRWLVGKSSFCFFVQISAL